MKGIGGGGAEISAGSGAGPQESGSISRPRAANLDSMMQTLLAELTRLEPLSR